MTREKLTALRHILQRLEEEYKNYLAHGETNTQAIKTEIEAVKEAIAALSEPCEDAISRQAVLMEIDKYLCGVPFDEKGIDIVIKELPLVKPQPKTGHWIIVDDCEKFIAKCSVCGRIEDSRMVHKYPYCHCGAKMKGAEECL